MITYAEFSCSAELCPKLELEGDSDLAGIGMVITYFLAATFTTIYFVALIPDLWDTSEAKNPQSWARYLQYTSGFRGSLTGFLDTVILFTVSMLGAALTRYSSILNNPNAPRSIYSVLNSIFVSSFCVFPALVLQSLSHDLRRRGVRLGLWFVLMALALAVEILNVMVYGHNASRYIYTMLNHNSKGLKTVDILWISNCDNPSLRQQLQTTLTAGHVVMALNCLYLKFT